MTTSISSEARRKQTSILIRGRKILIPPKPDGQTDICIYRVASLLKMFILNSDHLICRFNDVQHTFDTVLSCEITCKCQQRCTGVDHSTHSHHKLVWIHQFLVL